MNRMALGLAVGAGYVLGRTKKLKAAVAVGTMVAGKKMNLTPRGLADLVSRQMAENPQFKEIGDQLRQDLRGVGKAASGAVVERRLDSLADRLHGRTAQVRDQLAGVVPEAPQKGSRDEEEEADEEHEEPEAEEEEQEEPEAEEEEQEEPEAEEEEPDEDQGDEAEEADEGEEAEEGDEGEEEPPRKKAAAREAPAREAPARGAKKAPTKAPGRKTPAHKAGAKKSASARKTASTTASQGRGPKGGGER